MMKRNTTRPQTEENIIRPLKKSRATVILSLVSAAFLALTGLLIFLLWDYIKEPARLRDAIGEHYVLGAVALVLICAVQVVVALVPGEFVEIASGYIFGGLWGTVLCLIGILMGSCVTVLLVRRFGRRFVYVFYPKEKLDALPILNHPAKRNILTFVIFLIPGTPKDLFTYAIGLTDMSIPLYLLLTAFARLPSIVTSTVTGDAAGTKNYWLAVAFLLGTALLSGAGLLFYRRLAKRQAKQEDGTDTETS